MITPAILREGALELRHFLAEDIVSALHDADDGGVDGVLMRLIFRARVSERDHETTATSGT